jgi:hypothetical protein
MPTDDFDGGLRELLAEPWGEKAARLAVAIGQDAARDVLEQFIGVPGGKVLEANSADELVNQIRWASAVALRSVVAPSATASAPAPGAPSEDVW